MQTFVSLTPDTTGQAGILVEGMKIVVLMLATAAAAWLSLQIAKALRSLDGYTIITRLIELAVVVGGAWAIYRHF